MALDHDEFIRLLTDYYEFCDRVFWDLPISRAPPGGWPSITRETMAGLQKNDQALDLIRHLPYPEFDKDPQAIAFTPLIMDRTQVSDYRLEYIHKDIREDCLENKPEPYTDRDPPLPASCVCIATSQGRNGYFVVVDTEDGYVYWGDPNGQHDEPEPALNATLERFEDDEVNSWRQTCIGVNVYRPAEFFALCKQRFRELRWIGLGHWGFSALRMNNDWGFDEEHSRMADMMREAGWPGDGEGRDWDREKFLSLVEKEVW